MLIQNKIVFTILTLLLVILPEIDIGKRNNNMLLIKIIFILLFIKTLWIKFNLKSYNENDLINNIYRIKLGENI